MQNEEGDIEIIQGSLEGEHVVTSAQFMLDSESKLREAIQKMLSPSLSLQPSLRTAGHDMADPSDTSIRKEELEDLFK